MRNTVFVLLPACKCLCTALECTLCAQCWVNKVVVWCCCPCAVELLKHADCGGNLSMDLCLSKAYVVVFINGV